MRRPPASDYPPCWCRMTYVRHELSLPGGTIALLQPSDAAELPDDGAAEWAPLVPYSEVLWRSGVALARELAGEELAGRRVVGLGCGLAGPSLVAARAGAGGIATDGDGGGLGLVRRNARGNGASPGRARGRGE